MKLSTPIAVALAVATLAGCGPDARRVANWPSHAEACLQYADGLCSVFTPCYEIPEAECIGDIFDVCTEGTTEADVPELILCAEEIGGTSCEDLFAGRIPDSC